MSTEVEEPPSEASEADEIASEAAAVAAPDVIANSLGACASSGWPASAAARAAPCRPARPDRHRHLLPGPQFPVPLCRQPGQPDDAGGLDRDAGHGQGVWVLPARSTCRSAIPRDRRDLHLLVLDRGTGAVTSGCWWAWPFPAIYGGLEGLIITSYGCRPSWSRWPASCWRWASSWKSWSGPPPVPAGPSGCITTCCPISRAAP